MKTMKLGEEIRRVKEDQVNYYLANGWNYCPRSEWKRKVRDKEMDKEKDNVENISNTKNTQKKNKVKNKNKNKKV